MRKDILQVGNLGVAGSVAVGERINPNLAKISSPEEDGVAGLVLVLFELISCKHGKLATLDLLMSDAGLEFKLVELTSVTPCNKLVE